MYEMFTDLMKGARLSMWFAARAECIYIYIDWLTNIRVTR